jgi:MoxR-like ATPase
MSISTAMYLISCLQLGDSQQSQLYLLPPLVYLALIRAGRIRALLAGRDYMMPEDVKYLAHDILDHRIGLSYEASAEGMNIYQITEQILDEVRVP